MTLDYTEEGKLKIYMRKYLDSVISEFPHKSSDKVNFTWIEKMFKVDKEEKKMGYEKRTTFHLFMTKVMFLTKQVSADVKPDIYFLDSRVKEPTSKDWMELLRVISYLRCTKDDLLTLEADDEHTLYWYVDAYCSVHADMKSHTGYVFSLLKVMIVADSTKHKVTPRSST